MQVTTTFETDDVVIVFSATKSLSDYGPGTPKFYELEDVEIESVSVLGTDLDVESLSDVVIRDFIGYSDDIYPEMWE
jgi:hypothetical protein